VQNCGRIDAPLKSNVRIVRISDGFVFNHSEQLDERVFSFIIVSADGSKFLTVYRKLI